MAKLLSRFVSLFSFRRVWGLAITGLGLLGQAVHWGWLSLDVLGRLDVFWRIVESMGGTPATIASAISSWEFSLALIATGVGYTVFVGEPEAGTQRHSWWPYVAASVFFICFAAIGSVAIYGAIEFYIREQIAKGIAGVPRDESPGDQSRSQRPLYTGQWGLTADQRRILLVELPKLKPNVNILWLAIAPYDDGSASAYTATGPLQNLAGRSGLTPAVINEVPRDPSETGLMLSVRDPDDLSIGTQKFLEALAVADIHPKIITMPDSLKSERSDRDFIFFIGPRPFQ
jgi:hypothetical protein